MGFFPPIYESIVNILIYIAIAANLLSAKDNEERIKIGVIVVGFFSLLFLFPNDFFLAQTLIAAWLILTGAEMIVSRNVMIVLLALAAILSFAMPWFFFISFLFYIIVLGGFVLGAFRKILGKAKKIA